MKANLASIGKALWAARINATCDRWNLNNRALPALEKLAGQTGKTRLGQAVEHATRACELLDSAREELAEAIAVIEEYEGLAPAAPARIDGCGAQSPHPAGMKSA